jgi:hypothetical protein
MQTVQWLHWHVQNISVRMKMEWVWAAAHRYDPDVMMAALVLR